MELSQRQAASLLADRLDSVLFPNTAELEAWRSCARSVADPAATTTQGRRRSPGDGEALSFAAVVPTYCDRQSFYAATLPPLIPSLPKESTTELAIDAEGLPECADASVKSELDRLRRGVNLYAEGDDGADSTGVRSTSSRATKTWQRPFEAKQYFLLQLEQVADVRELEQVADAILRKLQWLYFPLDLRGEHSEDGTEDLNLIFERLAMRDAVWARPRRAAEFADMGPVDFIRNMLLGSFSRERHVVFLYKKLWLPLEELATERAEAQQDAALRLEERLRWHAAVGDRSVLPESGGDSSAASPEPGPKPERDGVGKLTCDGRVIWSERGAKVASASIESDSDGVGVNVGQELETLFEALLKAHPGKGIPAKGSPSGTPALPGAKGLYARFRTWFTLASSALEPPPQNRIIEEERATAEEGGESLKAEDGMCMLQGVGVEELVQMLTDPGELRTALLLTFLHRFAMRYYSDRKPKE